MFNYIYSRVSKYLLEIAIDLGLILFYKLTLILFSESISVRVGGIPLENFSL